MSTSLVVNGTSFLYPDTGDQSWGAVASAWAAAVTTGMLQKAGGTFSLTANVNFGTSFGLVSKHFTSVIANAAATGVVRLADADTISWRNNANSADLALGKNASDQLTWNGAVIQTSVGALPIASGGTGQTTAALALTALLSGSTVPIGNGGTGAATKAAGFDALSPMTTAGDIILGGASGTGTRLAIGANTYELRSNGTTAAWAAPTAITALTGDGTASGPGSAAFTLATVNSNVGTFTNTTVTVNAKGLVTAVSSGSGGAAHVPTVQTLTSSGTYTRPTSPTPTYIKVTMVGGGGGGGGTGGSGTDGTDSTFGSSLLTASGGKKGVDGSTSGAGGAGGTATITTSGTVLKVFAITGGHGINSAGTSGAVGGAGGGTYFGPGGTGANNGSQGSTTPDALGAGGGGAVAAGGGGGGGYLSSIITSPSSTYSYAVGPGGGGGSTGGHSGADGIIIVEEFYL